MVEDARTAEVATNYEAFEKVLPALLKEHAGRFALMRRGEVVECLDTFADAVRLGARLFADRLFSVQEVTDQRIELGFFSVAVDHPVR